MLKFRSYSAMIKGENEMLQALIFDMDGTLFQTEKILELSLDDTYNHLR